MPGSPSDGDYRNLIGAELGESTAAFQDQVALLWEMNSARGLRSKYLQFLSTRLAALNILLGGEWRSRSFSAHGRSLQEQQRFEHLLSLKASYQQDLDTYQKQLALGDKPVVGTLTTRAPVTSPKGKPDANSIDYLGNPNVSFGGRNA